MSTYFYLLILLGLFFATIITYHYVTFVTYGLPVSKIWTSLNCEEAIKKPRYCEAHGEFLLSI
ncbi:hypothetical protein J6836_03265 [Providencia sp. R33]|uniref:hypothetical protein n=1 Tax=Providencia TaxID=586 RepID=UPI001C5BEE8A|nr:MULTISPECIES: hypothetical protein [Providencia]QXX83436.1 hypothetical protein J6836_03265 [Providencia sp. R33]